MFARWTLCLLLLVGNLHAQSYFQVGDTLPDVSFTMIHYPTSSARISDFKGKLLILDFWATICSSCIDAFPKMTAFQEKFKDQLMILPVTGYGTKANNEAFFEKRKRLGYPVDLPSAVEADSFYKRFASPGLPYEVWVDAHGVIMAITGGDAVTEKNIQKVLGGREVKLPLMHRDMQFSMHAPLLVNGNGGPDSAFAYRSMITGRIDSIGSIGLYLGLVVDSSADGIRLFVANRTLSQMYAAAYQEWVPDQIPLLTSDGQGKLLEKDLKDGDRVREWHELIDSGIHMTNQEFMDRYDHCYELILPYGYTKKEAYRWMIDDLDRFFHIRSEIAWREVPALALVRLPGSRLPDSTTRRLEVTYVGDDFRMTGYPLDDFIRFLFLHIDLPLAVNRTGISRNIDLHLHIGRRESVPSLNQQLEAYGLKLVPTTLSVKKLILKDAQQ